MPKFKIPLFLPGNNSTKWKRHSLYNCEKHKFLKRAIIIYFENRYDSVRFPHGRNSGHKLWNLSVFFMNVRQGLWLGGKGMYYRFFNPLNPELNPIWYLLALLGAHHFLHVSRIKVKLLTFRRLMSYIYGARILDVSRSHTTTQHSR